MALFLLGLLLLGIFLKVYASKSGAIKRRVAMIFMVVNVLLYSMK